MMNGVEYNVGSLAISAERLYRYQIPYVAGTMILEISLHQFPNFEKKGMC